MFVWVRVEVKICSVFDAGTGCYSSETGSIHATAEGLCPPRRRVYAIFTTAHCTSALDRVTINICPLLLGLPYAETNYGARRAPAQSQEHRCRDSAQQPHRHHRPERLG